MEKVTVFMIKSRLYRMILFSFKADGKKTRYQMLMVITSEWKIKTSKIQNTNMLQKKEDGIKE